DHLLQPLLVDGRDEGRLAQVALPLARLLREDVLLVAAGAGDLARPGLLETLRGAAVRLHLRHLILPRRTRPPPRSGGRPAPAPPASLRPRPGWPRPPARPRPRPGWPPPPSRPRPRPSSPPRRPRGWARGSSRASVLPSAAGSRRWPAASAAPPPCPAA